MLACALLAISRVLLQERKGEERNRTALSEVEGVWAFENAYGPNKRKEQEFEDRVKRREELENKRAKPIAKKKKKGISKKIRTRHQGKRISDVPLKDLKSEVKGRIVRRVKKAKKDLGNTTLRKISKKIREAHIPPGMRKKKDKKKIAMKLGGFHTGLGSFIESGAASLDD